MTEEWIFSKLKTHNDFSDDLIKECNLNNTKIMKNWSFFTGRNGNDFNELQNSK